MRSVLVVTAASIAFAGVASAQDSRRSLDLGVANTGISIGDSRRWNGIRLNFRDTRLKRVNGLNATIWGPKSGGEGDVHGWSIGLPVTGARNVRGFAIAALGAGATESFAGIGVAGLGIGAGRDARGIMIGGLGVGGGGNITGIAIGGLGAGAGGEMRGIVIGGLGAGASNGFKGIGIGGLGVGGGGDGKGLIIGGLGAGFGGSFTGIGIGGLGVGAGDDATGLLIGGVGVGAGGSVRGIAIGGAGVGAPRVRGLMISGFATGGQDLKGAMFALGTVRTARDGALTGSAVSAVNQIRGHQKGIAIGIVNYAWTLDGIQLGVINIVRDNPKGRRVLPVINW